jgi:hypothetical protein
MWIINFNITIAVILLVVLTAVMMGFTYVLYQVGWGFYPSAHKKFFHSLVVWYTYGARERLEMDEIQSFNIQFLGVTLHSIFYIGDTVRHIGLVHSMNSFE